MVYTTNITGLSIILKDRVFYGKFDCYVLLLNGRNVVSRGTAVDEYNFCWFANLFSNFLILRAFSRKRYQKQEILFKRYSHKF